MINILPPPFNLLKARPAPQGVPLSEAEAPSASLSRGGMTSALTLREPECLIMLDGHRAESHIGTAGQGGPSHGWSSEDC